jgi:hypothetical protein
MSMNSGYLSLIILGTVILGVIGTGVYYTNKVDQAENRLVPTGMSYTSVSSDSYYGGKKTNKRKHKNKKTRRK